ncbi:MAG: PilZ domain-containing protein [Oscillospiraceae bacterium]|nr:PilZ domain-containing protein [Oscillospiraceae bacterium]
MDMMYELDRDYLSSVCEIKNNDNKLLASGSLKEIKPGEVTIGTKYGEMPVVKFGEKVKVSIHNFRKGFKVIGGVVHTSSPEFMCLKDVVQLVESEQRKFFRAHTNFKTMMDVVKKPGLVNLNPVEIEVVDISISGLGFKTDYVIDPERSYNVELELENKRCTLTFHVVRMDFNEDGECIYGCKLEEMPDSDTDILNSFVFHKQAESIREMRKNR